MTAAAKEAEAAQRAADALQAMGVWGCVDMYKASKAQSGQSGNYAPGIAKVVIGALALGIGEFLGSGSATLFGSDQTTGLDELGLR